MIHGVFRIELSGTIVLDVFWLGGIGCFFLTHKVLHWQRVKVGARAKIIASFGTHVVLYIIN